MCRSLIFNEYLIGMCIFQHIFKMSTKLLDRVSVPSPIVIDILMDTMARDRVPMYLFSV